MLIGSASSTTPSDLVGLTRFLTNTQDNTATHSDTDIVAMLNIEYRETQSFLLSQIMFDWKENTVNGTGTGLIDLVAGTNSYAFPTGLATIDRIELKYQTGTNQWVEANPIKLESMDRAISNTDDNASIRFGEGDARYWVRDGYIYIDPIPDTSVTGGMKVWCTTLITDLLIGGSGDQLTPVFNAAFHQVLSYGAAERLLQQKSEYDKAAQVERKKMQLRIEMVAFYSTRQADIRPRLETRRRNFN